MVVRIYNVSTKLLDGLYSSSVTSTLIEEIKKKKNEQLNLNSLVLHPHMIPLIDLERVDYSGTDGDHLLSESLSKTSACALNDCSSGKQISLNSCPSQITDYIDKEPVAKDLSGAIQITTDDTTKQSTNDKITSNGLSEDNNYIPMFREDFSTIGLQKQRAIIVQPGTQIFLNKYEDEPLQSNNIQKSTTRSDTNILPDHAVGLVGKQAPQETLTPRGKTGIEHHNHLPTPELSYPQSALEQKVMDIKPDAAQDHSCELFEKNDYEQSPQKTLPPGRKDIERHNHLPTPELSYPQGALKQKYMDKKLDAAQDHSFGLVGKQPNVGITSGIAATQVKENTFGNQHLYIPETSPQQSVYDVKRKSDKEHRGEGQTYIQGGSQPAIIESQSSGIFEKNEAALATKRAMQKSALQNSARGPVDNTVELDYPFHHWDGNHSVKVSIPLTSDHHRNVILLPSGSRTADAILTNLTELQNLTAEIVLPQRDHDQERRERQKQVYEEPE